MLQVTVEVDRVGSVHLANRLGWSRQRMFLALRRAVHKTGRWAYTRVVRGLAADTGIKQKTIRKRYVRLSLPKEHFPVAKVKIRDNYGTPLIDLHPRRTPTGIMFRTSASTETRLGAFKATMPRGHIGIFRRRGPARLPIEEQYKSVVIEAMQLKIDQVTAETHGRLKMEIDRQMAVMTKQLASGGRMRQAGEVGLTR